MDNFEIHIPRFKELPSVPLYKEQVIIYIETLSKCLGIDTGEKILTPTMINNYVKQKVVSPPKDKKYNEKHLAYFIVVCVLKQVYSIQEICQLINLQIASYPIDAAYDYFCEEFEETLSAVFYTRDFSYLTEVSKNKPEKEMVSSVIMSVCNKLYIQSKLLEKNNSVEKDK